MSAVEQTKFRDVFRCAPCLADKSLRVSEEEGYCWLDVEAKKIYDRVPKQASQTNKKLAKEAISTKTKIAKDTRGCERLGAVQNKFFPLLGGRGQIIWKT